MGEIVKPPFALEDIYLEPTIASTTAGIVITDSGYISGFKRPTVNRGSKYIYQLNGWFQVNEVSGLNIVGLIDIDLSPIGITSYDCDYQATCTFNTFNSHNYLGNQGVKFTAVGSTTTVNIDHPNPAGVGCAINWSLIIFTP
jgi:hypothetical protein